MKNISKIYVLCLMLFSCLTLHAQDTTTGKASYYSNKLHGRRVSDGTRYNKDSMTCAHLTYPLGTFLKVRNPKNDKEVIVKVTDRGPHSKRLMIDLSWAAAKELDIIRSGIALVEVSVYKEIVVPYRDDSPIEVPELDWGVEEGSYMPNFSSSIKKNRR